MIVTNEKILKHCIHYDGHKLLHERTCNKCVNIEQKLGGDTLGLINRIPCLNRNTPEFNCEFQEFRSDEEHRKIIEKRKKEMEVFVRRLKIIGPLVEDLKDNNPEGGNGVVECPVCKNKLHWTISNYNGHIHMYCETKNCVNFIE